MILLFHEASAELTCLVVFSWQMVYRVLESIILCVSTEEMIGKCISTENIDQGSYTWLLQHGSLRVVILLTW